MDQIRELAGFPFREDKVLSKDECRMRRPYIDKDGRIAVTVHRGRFEDREDPLTGKMIQVPILEKAIYEGRLMMFAMPKNDWCLIDSSIMRAARESGMKSGKQPCSVLTDDGAIKVVLTGVE